MTLDEAIKYYHEKSYRYLIHGCSTHFSKIQKDMEKFDRYRQLENWLKELQEWRTGKRKFEENDD